MKRVGMWPNGSEARDQMQASVEAYSAAMTPKLLDWLEGRGVSREVSASARIGLVREPLRWDEAYQDCLAIPYLTADGDVCDVRYRTLKGDGPKYRTRKGGQARLYGCEQLGSPTVAHLCEGELDALTLRSMGWTAYGCPGASAFSEVMAAILAGHPKLFVWPDVDVAGEKFADSVLDCLPDAKIVRLPFGDVSEVYASQGGFALEAALDEADYSG